jgi:hypothetical protein
MVSSLFFSDGLQAFLVSRVEVFGAAFDLPVAGLLVLIPRDR